MTRSALGRRPNPDPRRHGFALGVPMLTWLTRAALAANIVIIAFLFLNRDAWGRLCRLDLGPKYLIYISAVGVIAWLSFRPPRSFSGAGLLTKRRVAYAAFLCVFTLIALELLVRLVGGERMQTYSSAIKTMRYIVDGKESNSHHMSEKDSYYAFKLKGNLDTRVADRKYGVSQHVVTNADGFRFRVADTPRSNMMVLGDSLTFGVGVDGGETYPDSLQELLGGACDALNFGVGGWGFAEYHLTYSKYVKLFNPRLVVIGVFPVNDFNDLRSSEWDGKSQGALPCPPLRRADCHMDASGVMLPNDLAYSIPILRESAACVFICKAIIEPLISIFTESDSFEPEETLSLRIIEDIARAQKTLVAVFPASYQLDRGETISEGYLKRVSAIPNVSVLNLFPYFKSKSTDSYIDRTHLSKLGNRQAAEEIYRHIQAHALLNEGAPPAGQTEF